MQLEDRVCVITGSSRGIGRAIATEFGRNGARVVVNYRTSENKANEVVDQIESDGGTAVSVQADVTDRDQIEQMRKKALEAFSSIDVLVNNAGITRDTTFATMSQEDWDLVLDIHLGGMFRCTKAFFEEIENAEDGRLINISSIIGKQGNFGQANYAAAKSGMFGFTRTLALELAQSGSTANCIAPGFVKTDMFADIDEEIREQIRSDIPLGRLADPADIAYLAKFLASTESSYVTGEVIDVNGGKDL
jgi:3-oxoacyl-[acyl-carrier protein] reductase